MSEEPDENEMVAVRLSRREILDIRNCMMGYTQSLIYKLRDATDPEDAMRARGYLDQATFAMEAVCRVAVESGVGWRFLPETAHPPPLHSALLL